MLKSKPNKVKQHYVIARRVLLKARIISHFLWIFNTKSPRSVRKLRLFRFQPRTLVQEKNNLRYNIRRYLFTAAKTLKCRRQMSVSSLE